MKKIKTIVILILLMMPCLVKAIDCGTYKSSGGKTVYVKIQDNVIHIENEGSISSLNGVSSCPKEIYYVKCVQTGGQAFKTLNKYSVSGYDNSGCDKGTEIEKSIFSQNNNNSSNSKEPIPGKTASDKYSDIEECQDSTYQFIKECGCIPVSLTDLTRWLYFILKVMGPAIFVIIGAVELMKAMTAQDEKAVQGALNKLIKKLVAAVMIFFVLLAVQWVVELLAKDSEGTMQCVNYFLNGYKG